MNILIKVECFASQSYVDLSMSLRAAQLYCEENIRMKINKQKLLWRHYRSETSWAEKGDEKKEEKKSTDQMSEMDIEWILWCEVAIVNLDLIKKLFTARRILDVMKTFQLCDSFSEEN